MTRLRRDEGQAIVEVALALPIFLMLVLGLLDAARAVWQENTLALAAREGTRYAIVHGGLSASPSGPAPSDAAVANAVRRYAVGVPNVIVGSTWDDGDNNRGSRVTVIVTAPFVPFASQFFTNGALVVTVRGGSTMVIQR